jgi:hypothetical protein
VTQEQEKAMPTTKNARQTLKGDKEARRKDPHGLAGVDTAAKSEPDAWPPSDRQKKETAIARINKRSDPRAR